MADFDWAGPTQIERNMVERALTLDLPGQARDLVLMGGNGLGKTKITQNICRSSGTRWLLGGISLRRRFAGRSTIADTGPAAAKFAPTPTS